MWENRDVMHRDGTKRHMGKAARAAVLLWSALFLTACAGGNAAAGKNGQDVLGGEKAQNTEAGQPGQDADWLSERTKGSQRTKHDLRVEPEDMETVNRVDLNACETGRVILSDGGDIWLSGSLAGQLIVDAQEDELVHLYLAGVEITSPNGPALRVVEAAKVVVTLVSGTENVLADSPGCADCEESPACLYSVCDLTVNGDGALSVFGYYEDGVRSKDSIKILDGSLSVQAKGDGVRGNDGIYMQDASVEIESEKNGLRTVNQGGDEKGVIEIDGGTLSVIAGKNGLNAASDLYLYHGQCSVSAVEEKMRTEGTAYVEDGCMD